MGSQRRRSVTAAVLPALAVLGMLVLVWAATTGPVRILGTSTEQAATAPARVPTGSPPSRTAPAAPTYRELTRGVHATVDLSWLGQLIGYTAVVAACYGIFLLLRRLWRNRWRPPAKRVSAEFDVLPPTAVAEALSRDADAQRAALDTGGPRDSIVACWLRLEEIVALGGVAARPSETSTEFVTRALRTLDVDPRAIAVLAALYREARFSDHPMGEDRREQARAALQSLHDDLLRLGALS